MLNKNRMVLLATSLTTLLCSQAFGMEITHETCEIQLVSKPAVIDDKDSVSRQKLDLIQNSKNLLWKESDAEILKSKGYNVVQDIVAQDQAETVELEQDAFQRNRLLAVKSSVIKREYREVFAGEGYTKIDCSNAVQITNSENFRVLFEADGDQFSKLSYTSNKIPGECIKLKSNLEALPNCKIKM